MGRKVSKLGKNKLFQFRTNAYASRRCLSPTGCCTLEFSLYINLSAQLILYTAN